MVPMMVLAGVMVVMMVMVLVSGRIVRPVAGLGRSGAADRDGESSRRAGDELHPGGRDHRVPPCCSSSA
jgi:hypothetical protein